MRAASIVPRPARHEPTPLQQPRLVSTGSTGHCSQYLVYNSSIRFLAVTADRVRASRDASLQDSHQPSNVIVDMQPIANLPAVAVDRNRLTSQRLQNRQRNQLFWKLKRPVVVRTIRNEHRQPIRLEPRAGEVIGARLRRRVR